LSFYVINDNLSSSKGKLRYGVFTPYGRYIIDETAEIEMPGNASTIQRTLDNQLFSNIGEDEWIAFAVLSTMDSQIISRTKYSKVKYHERPPKILCKS